ncbi:uncharacterized protein LOC135841500 [Planococcus citri]|uniref:uncharacterized protein LOC135841500 n=1 Tax=Planococcus citri TaxID=170843 RepID=UPI0031F9FE70
MFNMEDDGQMSFVELQTITEVDLKLEPDDSMRENSEMCVADNSNQSYTTTSMNDDYVLATIREIDIRELPEEDAAAEKPKKKRIKTGKLKKKKLKSLGNGSCVKKKKRTKTKNDTDGSNKKAKCEYPRLCSGCGHAYKTKQSFWNHKQRCTMLPQNNRSRSVDENGCPIEGENGEYVRRKEYICAHCERPYRKKYNLQEHLKNTCRGKPCSKGRLQCWEEGCLQAFYKYVDLVQHVTLQHGQDLQIQKLQFPNFTAFNNWKTEESNSKFMYARKITGSKRFSNTKYHYFVCQFNHRNEKKNNNRKTNRRKSMNLVVPNYNCPSRIMVKECENVIQVTYISSHNHELNLSNVKYQPLEKETRTYIKTLLGLGVTAKKIIEHLQEGVGNPEIDSFLSTKQHFITLNRIKRMESKLKAKTRARQAAEQVNQENSIPSIEPDPAIQDDSYSPVNHFISDPCGTQAVAACSNTTPVSTSKQSKKEPDEVVKSIENNMKKLRGFMHKPGIKEKLSDRISKMIQDLCNECETVESTGSVATPKKPRATRKKKTPPAVVPPTLPPPQPQIELQMQPQPQLQIQQAIIIPQQTMMPQQQQHLQQPQQQQQHLHQQQQQQQHLHQPQHVITTIDPNCIVNVNTIVTNIQTRQGISFTPHIDGTSDLLKPIFQPFNVNLLCLKSIDTYISPQEVNLLKYVDDSFTLGWLCDAVVDSFLNLICQSAGNVLAANTTITQYVQNHNKVPDVWLRYNWNDIDTIFIPCNPSKKHWFLMVVLVKQSELQILDPASTFETYPNIVKKYASSINFWYNVLKNFLGMLQCKVTTPDHIKQNDPSDCGVLVCWYVFQYMNKRSLLDNVDSDSFRKYIYNTIISNSQRVE